MAKNPLFTSANIVTVIRILAVPLWLFIAEREPASSGANFALALFVLIFYIVLAASDALDGYLARSRDQVTDFGKFLDPIADKLVVIVALCLLLEEGLTSSFVLLVVVFREFLVSGLRMLVASKGEVIAASMLGKLKTATTMVAIGLLLFCRALPEGTLFTVFNTSGNILMLIAVVLTLYSGVDYFMKSWPLISES